jgi:hypothetical protein
VGTSAKERAEKGSWDAMCKCFKARVKCKMRFKEVFPSASNLVGTSRLVHRLNRQACGVPSLRCQGLGRWRRLVTRALWRGENRFWSAVEGYRQVQREEDAQSSAGIQHVARRTWWAVCGQEGKTCCHREAPPPLQCPTCVLREAPPPPSPRPLRLHPPPGRTLRAC